MKKNSLVTKSIRRILILGVALLIGITIVSALQFYNKVQQTYESVSNAYIAMIDSQYSTEEITSIINNKEELAKIQSLSDNTGNSEYDSTIYKTWERVNQFIDSTFYYFDFTRFQILIPSEDGFVSIWHISKDNEGSRDPMSKQTLTKMESAVIKSLYNASDIIYADNLLIHWKNNKIIGTTIETIGDNDGKTIAIAELDIDITQIGYSIIQLALVISLFIIFVLAFALNLYFYYTKREVLKPILQLDGATKNLVDKLKRNEKTQHLNIRTNDEIESLSHSFESMEENLRNYIIENNAITAEREQIKAQLSLATGIQSDMLIKEFPPFPERNEFHIYASMNPAKEVGGDFYDFFLIDDNQLALVIADVSGKGFPAALFMMRTMLMIQSLATNTDNPALILEKLNKLICKNNDSKMFVTVWLGILDLNTGVLKASNAGHEFPIIKEPGKQFELYKDKHSFVIGGKKKTKYKEYELVLRPGTTLFLYTDGVPEATNSDGIRFQIDNTLDALNMNPNASVDQLINTVATSVSDFVLDAEQFDDLTMLCIEYTGQKDNNNSEG
ncbi:MAG: HAMP domain-containing protein [Lachnospiraceae bacterium]|nr:HAMP domain-containing protein [Lachnospiraceae bacterium]